MPLDPSYDHTVPRRSDGTRHTLRPVQPWPEDKPFRILSIDGGGILGLLPSLVLAEIEDRFLDGQPIGPYFDLIAGTSTGGIIALALGQEKRAKDISNLYLERGERIFPPGNRLTRTLRRLRQWAIYAYDRDALENELRREFGSRRLGTSKIPLCIPAFEGRYGEPYIFKTPHHPDYTLDQHETLVDIALSTAAAPTYFAGLKRNGYIFTDGGIWANNPIMIGLVDALTCFDIQRRQVHILSLGCGQESFRLGLFQNMGGFLFWAKTFKRAAMKAQSHNALGQAGLLVGRDHLLRIDAPESNRPIEMDDVCRAISELPNVARALADASGHKVFEMLRVDPIADGTSSIRSRPI
ncbi:MAG TPA: CBASS cGAMP-activated phospholipase [Candidatus Competibacter sp.]|nr:CBASS cGAMP-activated phospholipase [Candidatus Competibacter sp.]